MGELKRCFKGRNGELDLENKNKINSDVSCFMFFYSFYVRRRNGLKRKCVI